MRREDLNVKCNFPPPINYTINNDLAPTELTEPLRQVADKLRIGIDDDDEERCLDLLKVRLENAYFSIIGPPEGAEALQEPEAQAQVFSSVNVNTASGKELGKALSGVSHVTAQAIINNRPYTSLLDIGHKIPSLTVKIQKWEETRSARVDGEAFLKGCPKQSTKPRSSSKGSEAPLDELREVMCALKFHAKVQELSELPDAIQASAQFRGTGIMPERIGGNLRSSKRFGTKMCMLRNCPATGRVIVTMICHRHLTKNNRTAVNKGRKKDAPPLAQMGNACVLYMAENKVELEEGNPGSVISIGEANGLDAMCVGYSTKLLSFKMLRGLQTQQLVVMDDDLREKMRKFAVWVEMGAKFDTATDHRGWTIPERKEFLNDVCQFMRKDVLTGQRIDSANPGPYINGIPKCTSEAMEITCFGIQKLYELCEEKGGKAATWVNTRAACSDVCEQLFAGTQNLTKTQFISTINKKALTLRNLQDPTTAFYMPMNSITKHAKQSRGCFNDPSAKHDVPVMRSVDDTTTSIGSVSLRVKANVKARKA